MLQRITKCSLIIAMASLVSFQAYAEEVTGSFGAEIKAKFLQTTIKDGPSVMDTSSEATLGYSISKTEGSWTVSGAAEFSVNADDSGKVETGNRFIKLENDSLSFALGNYDADSAEITLGKDYLDSVDQSMAIGNSAFEDAGGDYFKLGLKGTGLEFALGLNKLGNDTLTGDNGAYAETLIDARYSGEFDALTVAGSFTSVSEKIDEKLNSAGKDSVHDGASKTEIAVGAAYNMDNITLALNVDQYTYQKGGSPSPDAEVGMALIFGFNMKIAEDSGITVTYGTKSVADGSSNDETTSGIDIGYMKTIAGVNFTAGYSTQSIKDDDTKKDDNTTIIGAGLTYNF